MVENGYCKFSSSECHLAESCPYFDSGRSNPKLNIEDIFKPIDDEFRFIQKILS